MNLRPWLPVLMLTCVVVQGRAEDAAKPVVAEQRGLTIAVLPSASTFLVDSPIKFAVTFKNTGATAFKICNPVYWPQKPAPIHFVAPDAEDEEGKAPTDVPYRPDCCTLGPRQW